MYGTGINPSDNPPIKIHLALEGPGEDGGRDSKATRDGDEEYWNNSPWNVPYGESGGGGILIGDGRERRMRGMG